MKNIFSDFNIQSLKTNIFNIINRFPLLVILIIVLNALFFIYLHWDLNQNVSENILRSIFSVIITFFLSLWVYLASENISLSGINKNLFQLITLWFWVLFFMWFKNDLNNFDNIIFFLLTLAWIISFLFFSPYINKLFGKKDIQNAYYNYFYKISVVFLISTILWWVLFTLWMIWISTVSALFDIVFDKIYGDWAIIALSFIAPIFGLTQLPKKEIFDKNIFNENAFFSFLVKYIAIPFICVYFIILYAYSIKVLSNFWNWPKWEVSWMVIWFSIFGYIIYIFSYIFDEKNKFIKYFRKGFPYVVIPQLFMLFYAIFLRIAQYDITMNRYFIVVFGIWLAVISLYLIFSSKKYLAYIPLILTVFTIIISVWPWWVYSLPESRQLSRLEKNLREAWILKNWEIIPLKNYEDINSNLSKDIYSEISYLCSYNSCKSIKVLFSKQYAKLEQEHKKNLENNNIKNSGYTYNKLNNWEIINSITEEIKVKSYFEEIDDSNKEVLFFILDSKDNIFPIDTIWYSKILRISNYDYSEAEPEYAQINISKLTLEIPKNWQVYDTLNIKEVENKLLDLYKNTKQLNLKKEDLTFELKWKNWTYKIFFENINIKNPLYKWEVKDWGNYYAWWYVLVK